MRIVLFALFVLVAAVLLWVIRIQAYDSPSVFILGLLTTGLSGYLIADYFFNLHKKTLENDLIMFKKELEAVKEEKSILQKEISMIPPQADVVALEEKMAEIQREKERISGEFYAQAANIAHLNTKLDILRRENAKLTEEATLSNEMRNSEIEAIRDTLTSTKEKLTALASENLILREEINRLRDVERPQPIAEKSLSEHVFQAEELVERKIEETPASDSEMAAPTVATTHNILESHPHYGTPDNLKAIEGIGPKIEILLKEAGINTWQELAGTNVEQLRNILSGAGKHLSGKDPSTWAQQAQMLANGEWEKFKDFGDSTVK